MSLCTLEGRRHAILTRNLTCGHKVPANETTSESVKELCHGCREGSNCVVAVLVYQGYNDGIERGCTSYHIWEDYW